jgi:aspartate aminotransferase-like enzyme
MRDVCTAWVERAEAAALGVSLVARAENRSPTVTCIKTADRDAILQRMREQGYELGGGQAPLAKNTFRIGHMGDHTVAGVEAMLDVLERVLRAL